VVYRVSALVDSSVSVTASSNLRHFQSVYCCTVHSKRTGPMGFYERFPLYEHVRLNKVELHVFSYLTVYSEMYYYKKSLCLSTVLCQAEKIK
jgi:hypothetical protein